MLHPLLLGALVAANGVPPRSIRPSALSGIPEEVLQTVEPVHEQKHSRRRLAQKELTVRNTRPIKIDLDFSPLFEETAPQWSACFEVGAWFRRGLPEGQQTPPSDGIPTCKRGADEWMTAEEGCWGACEQADVITSELRDAIIHVVTTVVSEIPNFLRVRPNTRLKFDVSLGRYRKVYDEKGYTFDPACALDCNFLAGCKAPDGYCENSIDADAVFSVTRPPLMQGVEGSGTSCAIDNRDGRPIWLVFAWLATSTDLGRDPAADVLEYRHLVLHEAFHAMGFSHWGFTRATNEEGKPKNLLELVTVEDSDGRAEMPPGLLTPTHIHTRTHAQPPPQQHHHAHARDATRARRERPALAGERTRCTTSSTGGRTRWRRFTSTARMTTTGTACR